MKPLRDLPAGRVWTEGKADQAAQVILRQEDGAGASGRNELRLCAWEIGEKRATDAFTPTSNHVGLAQVSPYQGFTHWRIKQEWIDESARRRGRAWHKGQLILRLYDVSYLEFNGLNAHHIQDQPLPSACGHMFFKLPRPGTWQLAEVGFLADGGEFLPAARSQVASFAPDAPSSRGSQAALLVDSRGQVEDIANLWDQEKILHARRQPRLRRSLRIAAFAFAARDLGAEGPLAQFVSELAAGQCNAGHEVHVFVPASDQFRAYRQVAGVHYLPLDVDLEGSPLDVAKQFGLAAEKRLRDFPPFDGMHLHEWMTGRVPACGQCPRVLSLSSIEATRRQNTAATEASLAIERMERALAQEAPLVLTPSWLRDQAIATLGLEGSRVRAFPMDGRVPDEWELPLDPGQEKMAIGVGPLDRLILFVGPLEHAAGVDMLLEALPEILRRADNVRLICVGEGKLHEQLQERTYQLGIAHAVRLLGHVEGPVLSRLLRSSEAVVLPSRYRVPFDDAVVDLARRAGRPVITTHAGPAHLVRHEENGLLTYDNAGSLVWALDRVLGDPAHALRMGQNGRRGDGTTVVWADVARHYLELCAAFFPELRETK